VPSRRLTLLAVVALGVSAGATTAFLLLPAPRDAAATGTATTTSTTPPWVFPHETRIGSTVVVPTGLQMEGPRVLLTYDLHPIAPLADLAATEHAPEWFPGAAPASFTLTYPGGSATARVLGPEGRAARFDLPAGISTAQVESISVDSFWVPVPAGYTISLSPSSGDWVAAAPGLQARIVRVVEQAGNRLVIVEWGGETALAGDLAIAGEGREWRVSSYAMMGGGQWTLDFRGEALPDPVRLVVRGVGWIEVPGGGPVDLEGIPR